MMVENGRTPVDAHTAERLALSFPFTVKELENAQMSALRKLIKDIRKASGFYRERFHYLDPDELITPDDLDKLGTISARELKDKGGEMLCVSQSRVARVVSLYSSGSTGGPKRFYFSERDLAATRSFFLAGMRTLVSKGSRVLVLLPWEQPASVGELLITALSEGMIHACGRWPPAPVSEVVRMIEKEGLDCVVGMPYHLLALSESIGYGSLSSMLLCSDYAPKSLRTRIEDNCGARTFLHYGSTESGLGGAVECGVHLGCHVRESDLLVEVVDPVSGRRLADGTQGELVITTLQREAMPLVRYRTGDRGCINRHACPCGGRTLRLESLFGRQQGLKLWSGGELFSQELDECFFAIPGLLDFRASLSQDCSGKDILTIEYMPTLRSSDCRREICSKVVEINSVMRELDNGTLAIAPPVRVDRFLDSHTVKRTIMDLRPGVIDAQCY